MEESIGARQATDWINSDELAQQVNHILEELVFRVIFEPLCHVEVQRVFEIGSSLKELLARAEVVHHAAQCPRIDLEVTVETLVGLRG